MLKWELDKTIVSQQFMGFNIGLDKIKKANTPFGIVTIAESSVLYIGKPTFLMGYVAYVAIDANSSPIVLNDMILKDEDAAIICVEAFIKTKLDEARKIIAEIDKDDNEDTKAVS